MQRTNSPRFTQTKLATSYALTACLAAACGGGGGGGPSGGQNPNGPAVSAGSDAVVAERDTVMLRGNATENPAGGAITTFLWTQLTGTPVALRDADQVTASFVASDLGATGQETLTFRFSATDASGQSSSDDTAVIVQDARTAGGVVIYTATMNQSDQEEVFGTDTRGASPSYMVSGGVQHGNSTSVDALAISPDERWVAYLTDERQDDVYELFVARTDGSGASLAHPPFSSGDSIQAESLRWSPVADTVSGEHRIAFVAEISSNSRELYSTIPGSGTITKISSPISASNGDVNSNIEWAPDGSRMAYIADAETNNLNELFSALPDSATNTIKVSSNLVSGGDVTEFAWSPMSDQLAYRADATTDNRFELYVGGATSSGAVRVSQPINNSRDVSSGIRWTPDASATTPRIAYLADAATDNVTELWTTTADGSDVLRESGPLNDNSDVNSYFWSPDGAFLAYVADPFTSGVDELFIATAGPQSNANRVSGELTNNGDVRSSQVYWSPLSTHIAYVADQRDDGTHELFISSVDGSTNTRASGTMASGGDISDSSNSVRWSPDGDHIAYLADQNENGTHQLFTSDPLEGFTSNTVVSGRPAPGGAVTELYAWSRDGRRLIYLSDQDINNTFELWSTSPGFEPILAAENPKLSGSLPVDTNGDTEGDVRNFVTAER